MQLDRLGTAGKMGTMQKHPGELNRTPKGTAVVAKTTQRVGHVAGPSPEQPRVTEIVL